MSLKKMMMGVLAAQSGGGIPSVNLISAVAWKDNAKGQTYPNNGPATGQPSPAIDTTGATLLIVNTCSYSAYSTLSDSESNTWNIAASSTDGNIFHRVFYCINPTTDAAHTFTTAGSFSSYMAIALDGDYSSGIGNASTWASDGGASSPQMGNSIAYTQPALIISALQDFSSTIQSVDSGLTISTNVTDGSGDFTGALAFGVVASGSSINPEWTFSGNRASIINIEFPL